MKNKVRVQWSVFSANSSSEESVADFARGMSFMRALGQMWCPDARREFRKLRSLPVANARRRAGRWCNKHFAYWR